MARTGAPEAIWMLSKITFFDVALRLRIVTQTQCIYSLVCRGLLKSNGPLACV